MTDTVVSPVEIRPIEELKAEMPTAKEAIAVMLDELRAITPNVLVDRVTAIMSETQSAIFKSQALAVMAIVVEECAKVAEANKADPVVVQAIRDIFPTKDA